MLYFISIFDSAWRRNTHYGIIQYQKYDAFLSEDENMEIAFVHQGEKLKTKTYLFSVFKNFWKPLAEVTSEYEINKLRTT